VSRVTEVAVLLVNRNSPLTKEETMNSKYWPKASFQQNNVVPPSRLFCRKRLPPQVMGWSMWEVYHNRLTQRTCAEGVIPFQSWSLREEQIQDNVCNRSVMVLESIG
jgi:hypothetical protein